MEGCPKPSISVLKIALFIAARADAGVTPPLESVLKTFRI